MNGPTETLQLSDLDTLLDLVSEPARVAKMRRMGLALEGVEPLLRERARLAAGLDRRWINAYDRSLLRYGRGLTPVLAFVCQGCFVTLPTSAAPPPGEVQLHLCQSCGRLLLWS